MNFTRRVKIGLAASAAVAVSVAALSWWGFRRPAPPDPAAAAVVAPQPPAFTTLELTFRRGDNLEALLIRAGIEQPARFQAITAIRKAFDVKKFRAGRKLTLTRTASGELEALDYLIDADRQLRLLVEKKYYANGTPPTYQRILAAEYNNAGTVYDAYLFPGPDGKPYYYSRDGSSLQSAFLRSPLKFSARVSSHFSYRRLHPILKVYRPHYGTDYAAPTGTPVYSVADGRVVFSGRSGGGGNVIKIRHANGFMTEYLHLSRRLVRVGQRVKQGQRIGLVGSTGLATGPHLDFRLLQHGRFKNFERLRLPPASKISPQQLPAFAAVRDRYRTQMDPGSPGLRLHRQRRLQHRPRVSHVVNEARVAATARIVRPETGSLAVSVERPRVFRVDQTPVFLPHQLAHHREHVHFAVVRKHLGVFIMGHLHAHVAEMHVVDPVPATKIPAHRHRVLTHLSRHPAIVGDRSAASTPPGWP